MANKLNLGEQLSAANIIRKGPPCTMSVILAGLEPDDRAALLQHLIDSNVAHTVIYRVLVDNGFTVSLNTVQRHRRKECACEPR